MFLLIGVLARNAVRQFVFYLSKLYTPLNIMNERGVLFNVTCMNRSKLDNTGFKLRVALSNLYVYNEGNERAELSAWERTPLDRLVIALLFEKFPAGSLP
jgi:hypothetical protein